MCCRCQDSLALCNNDLGTPARLEQTTTTTTRSTTASIDTTTTAPPCDSVFEDCEVKATCDPIFGCSDAAGGSGEAIIFGSDYVGNVDEADFGDSSTIDSLCDPVFGCGEGSGEGSEKGSEETVSLLAGVNCANSLACRLQGACSEGEGECLVEGVVVSRVDAATVDLRTPASGGCPRGQSLCCNPVPGDLLRTALDRHPQEELCAVPDLAATANFEFGLACGRRDTRVYHEATRSEAEGGQGEESNPGEWPWSTLIFRTNGTSEEYVGAGSLLGNLVVATTATKVREFQGDPRGLRVRLGDWDPLEDGPSAREQFPHLTLRVSCLTLHPKFDPRSLAFNVAVLELEAPDLAASQAELSVQQVVGIRSGAKRPADHPEGVDGWSRNPSKEGVGLRQGSSDLERRQQLLADLTNEVSRWPIVDILKVDNSDTFVPLSYINTICLPDSEAQLGGGSRCWVAAWGGDLRRQREVELPLVGPAECNAALGAEFRRRGATSWSVACFSSSSIYGFPLGPASTAARCAPVGRGGTPVQGREGPHSSAWIRCK